MGKLDSGVWDGGMASNASAHLRCASNRFSSQSAFFVLTLIIFLCQNGFLFHSNTGHGQPTLPSHHRVHWYWAWFVDLGYR